MQVSEVELKFKSVSVDIMYDQIQIESVSLSHRAGSFHNAQLKVYGVAAQ